MRFLLLKEAQTGVSFTQPVLDTLLLSQVIHPLQLQRTLEANRRWALRLLAATPRWVTPLCCCRHRSCAAAGR